MIKFCDSFDHYAVSDILKKWDFHVNTLSFVPGFSTGSNALSMSTLSRLHKIIPNNNIGNIYFNFYLDSVTSETVMFRLYNGATIQIELRINSSRFLTIYRGTTSLATTSIAIPLQQWCSFILKFNISNSIPANSVKIWVNLAEHLNLASGTNTQNASSNAVTGFEFARGTGANIFYDDFMFFDDENIDVYERRIILLTPVSGSNTFTNSDTSTTDNALMVNQVPIDYSKFITSTTTNNKTEFTLSNLPYDPLYIDGHQICVTCKKDNSTVSKCEIGGIVTEHVTTDYVIYSCIGNNHYLIHRS